MPASVHVLLTGHPANPQRFHQRVDATIARAADGGLVLGYRIQGLNLDLHVPTPHTPAPAEALWKTTCCELFIGPSARPTYREFNFSPSGQWAAYRFRAYRDRDNGFVPPAAPQLELQRHASGFRLSARIAPELLPPGRVFNIGLSAVVEAADGGKSYWALAHAAAQPDFHLRPSFTLTLNRP